jgi:DNA-binding MarR family transcriptional regulator/N-acetylglutamate synthase-like GNAT family acetyltransferase
MNILPSTLDESHVAAIRKFNRFYSRTIGFLAETLSASPYTLTEARVLFELGQQDETTAVQISQELRLDPAYLARILKIFREKGLLDASADEQDARRRVLRLTKKGTDELMGLQRGTNAQIERLIGGLRPGERDRLVQAMGMIETLLGEEPGEAGFTIRPHRVGDVGWIVHRQAVLYEEEYGWDIGFEGLIAEIGGRFIQDFDAGSDRCWIAERRGAVVGSVFLVRESEEVGKLRLLYVEPDARGLGIGRALVEECIAGARAAGYGKLVLWTNDVLVSARRIYQAAGFTLASEERHHSFGKNLVGQYWEMGL